MSTSSAAGKLHFHRGWKALAVRRALCVPVSPQRPQTPGRCWLVQVTWSHRCDPPGSKPVQTDFSFYTQANWGVLLFAAVSCAQRLGGPLSAEIK